ncbi:hypothetical protein [Trinickia dinghuensis]|uniref:Uncharacterized protein n=1 Tax=Trinickia dinghuensis TaxID=2291023 RepID=A0A3D8JWM2_9BURK|nr:hypothetical protein [Trinickia dinghuensis]RDU97543.1 hypothetical protein DWV00_16795 [Trinickia dinghuensis]
MSPLLTIQCSHSYFFDGVCRVLSLMPTSACASMLARYRLLFRSSAGGGIVYYQEGVSPLAQFDESAPLAFWLIGRDPALLSYTDSNSSNAAGLFYFDNLLDCKLASGTLTAPQLPCLPARFGLPLDPPRRAMNLELFRRLDGGKQPVWQGRSPDVELAALALDFGVQDEGRYQLVGDGAKVLDFWLGHAPADAWGVVAIYPGGRRQAAGVAPAARAIDEKGEVSPKCYSIELLAKQVFWRYNLIGQTELNFEHYELLARRKTGEPVLFGPPQGAQFNGQPSCRFVAREPLPLAERPGDVLSVRLASKPDASPQLNLSLAYPRPENVGSPEDGKQFADVLVFL